MPGNEKLLDQRIGGMAANSEHCEAIQWVVNLTLWVRIKHSLLCITAPEPASNPKLRDSQRLDFSSGCRKRLPLGLPGGGRICPKP